MPSLQVLIKRRKRGRTGVETWEVVRARGHLDEVQELKATEPTVGLDGKASKESMQLVLTEGAVLGGGAFSRVSIVTGGWPPGAAVRGPHAPNRAGQSKMGAGRPCDSWLLQGMGQFLHEIVLGRRMLRTCNREAAAGCCPARCCTVSPSCTGLWWAGCSFKVAMVTAGNLMGETVCAKAHLNQPTRPETGHLPA